MGTNTGTGGFDIDGKSYTFDVGTPGDPGIPPQETDHGDISVDNSKKDLGQGTKETLGKYLGKLTQRNARPVDPETQDVALTTRNGIPAPISDTPNEAYHVERKTLELPADASEELQLGTRYVEKTRDPRADLEISKGNQFPQRVNGNQLLKRNAGNAAGYVSTVLSNNRFTESTLAADVNLRNPSGYNPSLRHPQFGDVTHNRLAQVGVSLSVRASQELNAASARNNPSSATQEVAALLPGFNQLGASRVDTRVLEARDVLDDLTNSEISDSSLINIARGGSWGSMNNVHDPYSGITALGMIALSLALTAAVVVLFEGLAFLLSLIKGSADTGASKNVDGRYVLGRYTMSGDDTATDGFPSISFPPDISTALGVRKTVFPFSAALNAGVAAFFGLPQEGGIVGQILGSIDSSVENPGFNAVVARSILRSGVTIVDSFKTVANSANLISGAKNVLNVIDVIKGSKIIQAINVFATLGDQVLTDNISDVTADEGKLPGEPTKKSLIDKLDDEAGAVQKNRLNKSNNKLKLAWSSNRAPSMYLLPDPLAVLGLTTGDNLGGHSFGIGEHAEAARIFYNISKLGEEAYHTKGRIPYDGHDDDDDILTVKKLEGLLEAEYMPFYLHDLRTNEIISFHAFITQLTDDYTANWESSEGYGRVDPVRIYKNTQRRINIGFMIASTSEEDFKDMWQKINKLITLVYPQYTAGRLLTTEDNSTQFTQPFSQLMGASPLVRLRLGDLFRSNYSRFALARLFGADSNVMKLGGSDLTFANAQSGINAISTVLKDKLNSPKGNTFLLNVNDLPKISNKGTVSISLSLPNPLGGDSTGGEPQFAPRFSVLASDIPFFTFTVESVDGDNVIVTPNLLGPDKISEHYGYSSKAVKDIVRKLEDRYKNPQKNKMSYVVGGKYVASKGWLFPTQDDIKLAIQSNFSDATAAAAALTDNGGSGFLDPERNAIVKSFRSVQGKGLAGTIDSINFDWYENIPWEIKPGHRAPKMCHVTMAFSPIHDISPGLDHNGYNRAPVYPVGYYAPKNDNS